MANLNSFLTRLLDLEVSGKDAISAPGNWATEPLLNIQTDVDQAVNDIAPSLIANKESSASGVCLDLSVILTLV